MAVGNFRRAASQARGGLVLTAALKLLPMLVLVLPGLAVRALVLECGQGTLDAIAPSATTLASSSPSAVPVTLLIGPA